MRILICDDEGIVQQAIRFMIQKSFGDEFEIASAKKWAYGDRTCRVISPGYYPDGYPDAGDQRNRSNGRD